MDKKPDFDLIIRPIVEPSYTVDWFLGDIDRMLVRIAEGTGSPVELCPDFQRGHIWTEAQQIRYIESMLRGLISTPGKTISFNAPNWHHDQNGDLPPTVQCIDGLQRLTAARRFMADELRAFGFSVSDFKGTRYDLRHIKYTLKIAIFSFQNRSELLQYYIDINDGGTPHTEAEIMKVKNMLAVCGKED